MSPKFGNKTRSYIAAATVLILSLALAGCHFTETLWSSKVDSPYGKYTALVQTDDTDTIGNVAYTVVRIKEKGSWHAPKTLVVFDGGIDEEEDFQIKWSSPLHIDIVVHGYAPDPVPYRRIDKTTPITFSVNYMKKPYKAVR
jgi:hypothetical protein